MLTDAEAREIAGEWLQARFPGLSNLVENGAVLPALTDEVCCAMDNAITSRHGLYPADARNLNALLEYARHHAGRGPVPGWPATTDDTDR